MDDEEAFQDALDADPSDYPIRLIFADWLGDQGDDRAEGYRALGINGRVPHKASNSWQFCEAGLPTHWHSSNSIPKDWFELVEIKPCEMCTECPHKDREFRRDIEDSFALAFAKLPANRQAELLKQTEEVDTLI